VRGEVDLSKILNEVSASMVPIAQRKGLALVADLPNDLKVTGHTDSLIRLFINLIDNAVKYTIEGVIHISAKMNQQQFIVVEVLDTGIGIPPEHLPHIFERFYRVEQSRTSEGVGLGLAIAHEIVSRHGGRIEVSSSIGEGSIFKVYLPRT
jgi:signal transduction histidine kinase